MAEPASGSNLGVTRLILVPSLITLAVTIVRLVGELQHWSPRFFNASAGGGAAVVGIVWLPIIFGPYFALKLAGAGQGPKSAGRVIGYATLGLIIFIVGGFVGFAPQLKFPGKILVGLLLMVAAAVLQFPAWSPFAKTLLAYGFAARIPVAIVMYFAIAGSWGTHYDALPPDYGVSMSFWRKYFEVALVPQLVMWVGYTVIVGSLFGGIVTAVARRGKPAAQAAS